MRWPWVKPKPKPTRVVPRPSMFPKAAAYAERMVGAPVGLTLATSAPTWTFTPVDDLDGPYTLMRNDTEEPMIYAFDEYATFVDAIAHFARIHLPRPQQRCSIIDQHNTILVGWVYKEGVDWIGCKHAFDLLDTWHPIDAIMWRAQAEAMLNPTLAEEEISGA